MPGSLSCLLTSTQCRTYNIWTHSSDKEEEGRDEFSPPQSTWPFSWARDGIGFQSHREEVAATSTQVPFKAMGAPPFCPGMKRILIVRGEEFKGKSPLGYGLCCSESGDSFSTWNETRSVCLTSQRNSSEEGLSTHWGRGRRSRKVQTFHISEII